MHQANILSVEDFNAIPDASLKLQAWVEHQAILEYLKGVELVMRREVFSVYFPGLADDVSSGLKNYDLGHGYLLKGTPSFNYALDKEKVDPTLGKIEKLGAEGKLLADRLVNFNPSLSISEYKKLDPKASRQQAKVKELIDDILTIKPGTPKLEYVIPKTAAAG